MESARKRTRSAATTGYTASSPAKYSPYAKSVSPTSLVKSEPSPTPYTGIADGNSVTYKVEKKIKLDDDDEKDEKVITKDEPMDCKYEVKDELAKDDPCYDVKVEGNLKEVLQPLPHFLSEKEVDLLLKYEDEQDDSNTKPNKRRKIAPRTAVDTDLADEEGSENHRKVHRSGGEDDDADSKVENTQDKSDASLGGKGSPDSLKPREFRIPMKFVENHEAWTAPDEGQQGAEVGQENSTHIPFDSSQENTPTKRTKTSKRQTRGRGKVADTTPIPPEEQQMSTRLKRPSRKASEAVVAEEPLEDGEDASYVPSRRSKRGATKAHGKGKTDFANNSNNSDNKETAEAPKKLARKSVWDKETLLISKKSKLAKAYDLNSLLNCATWDLLSDEEKTECLALLPTIDKVYSTEPDGKQKGHLAPDFFESNQVFRDSLIEFQEDLLNGRYEQSYLVTAANARIARLEGTADNYKDGQYELYWGQRMRGSMVAGAAAQIKMPELISRGILKAGDMWEYKRRFKLGKERGGDLCIEKQVKVVSVNSNHSLNFAIPPGAHVYSDSSRKDLIIENVVAPQTIESVILKTHTKTPEHVPNGNAYKCFNVWRNGEDLGPLWEIRQTYWGGS